MKPNIVTDDKDKDVSRLVVGGVDDQIEEKPKRQRKRGPTIMFDETRVRSEGERKIVGI